MDLESVCNCVKDIDELQLRDLLANSLCDGEMDLVQVGFAYGQKAVLKWFIKRNLIYPHNFLRKDFTLQALIV